MTGSDILFRPALDLASAIRSKQLSPVEVLDACLAQVDALNPELVAVVWRNDDDAREQARRAADQVVKGDPDELAPFHGVPIPVKDLTAVAGWPVTYGSWGAPDRPSAESALVVEAFQRAGRPRERDAIARAEDREGRPFVLNRLWV